MRIHANRSIKVIYSIVALTTITALAISSCKTVYKVGLTVLNPTKDTIRSIGYQSDFAVDPSSSAPLLSTKPLPPDSSFRYEKKLKIEQGKNLYLFAGTNRTNSAIYNSTIKINESNSNLIVGLKAIDSTSVYKRTSDIQNWFESVSEGIIDSRNRMPYLTSQLSNIMTLLPAILIVDSTAWQLAVKNKGLLEKNSNNLSFYTASDLKITPAPIILGGEDKVKKIRIESNGNIESSFKFPFAANLNLNISSEGLYDVNLKILAAGWVPIKSQNGATPLEAIFSLDSIGSRSTLLDMLRQLQKGRRAKVVTSAYMYQGLTIQTIKYDKIRTDFSGAYASVLSTNGAYQRSESEDFVNTLPTTITHVEIGNDVTEALKENLELIVSSVYLQNKASGKTNTSEVSELVPDSIKAITGNYEAELKKLQLEIEILKKKESRVIEIDKTELLNKAYKTFERSEYSVSKEYWTELIRLDSLNSEYYSRRGYCYRSIGLYDNALKDYNLAIQITPNAHFYFDNRAELQFKLSNWTAAYNDLTQSIALNPNKSAKTFNNRGIALINLSEREKACQDFEKAMNLGDITGQNNYNKYCK